MHMHVVVSWLINSINGNAFWLSVLFPLYNTLLECQSVNMSKYLIIFHYFTVIFKSPIEK